MAPIENRNINGRDEQLHRYRFSAALNGSQAFQYVDNLAPEDFNPHGVYRVQYNKQESLPVGFGAWPLELLQENAIEQADTWLEQPEDGQSLIFKIGNLRSAIDCNEVITLSKLNSLFTPDDIYRPVRMLGYGQSYDGREQKGYLVLEDLGSSHMSLQEYLRGPSPLSLEESLEISTAMATLLQRSHKKMISHNDLEGPSALDHVWWSPTDRSLRIIDWHNGQWNKERFGFSVDQTALGQILMKSATGSYFNQQTYIQKIRECYTGAVAEQLIQIVGKAIGYDGPRFGPHYSRTAKGTSMILSDLIKISA